MLLKYSKYFNSKENPIDNGRRIIQPFSTDTPLKS